MFRNILLSSLTASLQGPDGILSLPRDLGLGFACHQRDIQTSARTLTILPFPIRLVSQEVKVIMGLCSCPLHQELCLRGPGVSRLPMFENGGKVGELLWGEVTQELTHHST